MSIGLVMIVKDEAHVIRRCLESVRPFIDWWVIADTGSCDDTREIIRDAMEGVPGSLLEHAWVDFAHNRNRVLDEARRLAGSKEYALTIDADEVFAIDDSRCPLHDLTDDGYYLPVEYDGTIYERLALVRLDRPWRWEGVVHELLVLEGASIGRLAAPTIVVRHEGARSRDPETYSKDAALLERHLADHPKDARAWFYLAQSYRFAGVEDMAVNAYQTRATLDDGYWQERWYSLWQLGRLTDSTQLLLSAFAYDTRRAEPLVDLATRERLGERYPVALLCAREATHLIQPTEDALFVDVASYTWRCWDERAMAAYYCGEYAEAAQAARRALSYAPEDPRLIENLRHCEAML